MRIGRKGGRSRRNSTNRKSKMRIVRKGGRSRRNSTNRESKMRIAGKEGGVEGIALTEKVR